MAGSSGWALSRDALSWTTDAGLRWKAITPPGVPAGTIRGVYFLNTSLGWVASTPMGTSGRLLLSVTRNGGGSWSTSPVGRPVPGTDPGLPAYVDFTDALHGWVVSMVADNANFATGLLFATANGGKTWRMLRMPAGGPVEFVSATTGWLADGRQGGPVYVTSTGGRTWRAATVVTPAGYAASQATYAIPAFTRPDAVVIATFDNGTTSAAGFYGTSDAGTSWQLKAAIPAGRPAAGAVMPAAGIAAPGQWLAIAPGRKLVVGLSGNGTSRVVRVPVGLPSSAGTGFAGASFTSSGAGWVVSDTSACTGIKSGCTERVVLWSSADGGGHWTPVTVP